jgi:hypothetical protein
VLDDLVKRGSSAPTTDGHRVQKAIPAVWDTVPGPEMHGSKAQELLHTRSCALEISSRLQRYGSGKSLVGKPLR